MQEPSENPALFQAQLVEAMRKYTNLDPETLKGQAILAVHFISQASLDSRQKLQKPHKTHSLFCLIWPLSYLTTGRNLLGISRNRRRKKN